MNPDVVALGIVEYKRSAGTSGEIIFRAENVRSEKTGVHARLLIYYNTTMLCGSVFNIERDEDRNRIVNTAHRMLGQDRDAIIDKADLKHELDLFAFSVWPTLMSVERPRAVKGAMIGPPVYLAKSLVLENSGTILFGPGMSAKSTTGFLLGIAVDSGTNGIWETLQTRVLYGNLERSHESIVRRIFAANGALGLEPDRPLDVITARGKSLASIEPIVRRHIQNEGIGLFILDSISRARMGKLTDDDTANMTIDILNSFGVAWLAIGHTSKENKDETFGSVHYGNGADITAKLSVERRGSLELGVRIEVKKANDIAFPPPMTLKYMFDQDYGLQTAAIAGVDDYPDLGRDTRPLPQKIYDCLVDEKGKASATEIAEILGVHRSAISRVLTTDDRFVSLGHQGKEVVYAVKANV